MFIHTVNTGIIDLSSFESNLRLIELPSIEEEEEDYELNLLRLGQRPLQLTSYYNGNLYVADDDVVVTHVRNDDGVDGLQLSMPTLTNNQYVILYDENGNPHTVTFPMTGANDTKIEVFLPRKSGFAVRAFDNGNDTIKNGLMRLDNIKGLPLDELNDSDCLLFLAEGHESLNVESIQSDDMKFKTFNGSITFDRSLTKITRLFSMSNSNSCIGYINDILSARLSRYYFVANYNIFNTFFDSNRTTPFTNSLNQNEAIYVNYGDDVYTGDHEILLANCGDIVKLIGSDVITNNCMPGITPEEHRINMKEITDDVNNLIDLKDNIELSEFVYKIFHYYNSGFNHWPSIGGTVEQPNGCSLLHVNSSVLTQDFDVFTNDVNIDSRTVFCITNKELANNALIYPISQLEYINTELSSIITSYRNNILADWVGEPLPEPTPEEEEEEEEETPKYDNHFGGIISVLPCPRVYRNNNFEQSDLTISTGRIKTLSPVYIQSVNRVTLNNIIYMFDMMYNMIVNKYGSIHNGSNSFDYLTILRTSPYSLSIGESGVLRRFSMKMIEDTGYYPLSFDSCWLMNYLTVSSVNEYADTNELSSSLPIKDNEANSRGSASHNEEIIEDIITYKPETNIQLFSSRHFNFHENISVLSVVCWVQVINKTLDLDEDNCWIYFGKDDDVVSTYTDNFYSETIVDNSFNLTRTVKTLISKLGEFLDFPKIVFGSTLAFNQSKSVNIQYTNPLNYINPFKTEYKVNDETNVTKYEEDFVPNSKQKNNVALFGVIFKYHQLSLGWQQMINELQETYLISRSRGQKQFVVKIYDEFGRQIPNVDTSQGFKNNLRLEINCINYS